MSDYISIQIEKAGEDNYMVQILQQNYRVSRIEYPRRIILIIGCFYFVSLEYPHSGLSVNDTGVFVRGYETEDDNFIFYINEKRAGNLKKALNRLSKGECNAVAKTE